MQCLITILLILFVCFSPALSFSPGLHFVQPNSAESVEPNLKHFIQVSAKTYSVDSDFLEALAWTESHFRLYPPNSYLGARGPFQIMPIAATEFGCFWGWIANPAINTDCAARMVAQLLKRSKGNKEITLCLYYSGNLRACRSRQVKIYVVKTMKKYRRIKDDRSRDKEVYSG